MIDNDIWRIRNRQVFNMFCDRRKS